MLRFSIEQHSKWVYPIAPFIELSHPCPNCGEVMSQTLEGGFEPRYKNDDTAIFTVWFSCDACDPDEDEPVEIEYKIKSVVMEVEKVSAVA